MESWKKGMLLLPMSVVFAACDPAPESEPEIRPWTFTPIEYPGASATVVSGLSDAGDIAGFYERDGVTRGFVRRAGTWTSVEYPGAVMTQLTHVAHDGSTVGAYRNDGEPGVAFHAFVRTPEGEFSTVSHPDHAYGMAQRLLPDGTILGCYHDEDFTTTMRAISVADGEISVLDLPGGMYGGGTPDGRMLAGFTTIGRRGFIVDDGQVRYLEAPGSTATEAWDINPDGIVAGVQVDSADVSRGFVLEGDRWETIMLPDARSTIVFGINGRGDLAGAYVDAEGVRRGFIASRR